MPRLLDPLLSLFGFCRHRHVTWPQRRRVNGIYVGPPMQVCTECGKTWVYDWEHMRPESTSTRRWFWRTERSRG